MDADDRSDPPQWSTMSPEHLDQLACGVLRAARVAARALRENPPDPARRTWALGMLAGQTQAMLGPDLPDHPPVEAEAQEGFVHTALVLALHVRAHSWSERDLGAADVPGQDDVPHPGERRSADAFDVLGRLMLPHASPEGWTATLVTDLARGDKTLEAAVKLGKYVLHPTFLALTDDATRLVGEAWHNINVDRLQELTQSLRHHACAGPPLPASEPTDAIAAPMPLEPKIHRQIARPTRNRPARKRGTKRVPEVGSAPRSASTSGAPAQSAPPSEQGAPDVQGAPGYVCSAEPASPAAPWWVDNPVADPSLTKGGWGEVDGNTVAESGLLLDGAELANQMVSDESEFVSYLDPIDIPDEDEPRIEGMTFSRADTLGFHAPRLRGFGR